MRDLGFTPPLLPHMKVRITGGAGFTLLEALITASVIAILAAVALPQYTRAVQRSYWRTARQLLETMYAGEQVYQTAKATYVDADACAPAWRCIYMDDPTTATIPVAYAVSGVTATTFLATATFTPTGKTQTVNQNRAWGGTWAMP